MYQRKKVIRESLPSDYTLESKFKGVSDAIETHEKSDKQHLRKVPLEDDNYDNEEWVLFGDSYMDDIKTRQNKNDDVNSVLSTRLSGYQTVTHDVLSSDVDDNYADLENNAEDEDDDSFINDIRESFRCINKIRSKELQEEFHNELVSKVNDWKNDVQSASASLSKNSGTTRSMPNSKLNPMYSQYQTKREIKRLKKVVKHVCSTLQKDGHVMKVKHEGVFMNNPDLESCIPSYWKRLMLDNMIYANQEQNNMLNVYVSRDDILNKGRHFWEIEESASISTGWESGNNIVGF